jgi:hypothetical protein
MKYRQARPFAEPEAAARKLLVIVLADGVSRHRSGALRIACYWS